MQGFNHDSGKHSRGKHWIATQGLAAIQATLGHINVQNTQIYARMSDEEADESLRKAIAADSARSRDGI